jgi:hypothetical protein
MLAQGSPTLFAHPVHGWAPHLHATTLQDRVRLGSAAAWVRSCARIGCAWPCRAFGFVRTQRAGFARTRRGRVCGLPGVVRAHGLPAARAGLLRSRRASGSFGFTDGSGSFGRGGLGFVRKRCEGSGAPVRSDPHPRDTAAALTMTPCSLLMFTGGAAMPPREASSVADYGNLFNPHGTHLGAPATESGASVEVIRPGFRPWCR